MRPTDVSNKLSRRMWCELENFKDLFTVDMHRSTGNRFQPDVSEVLRLLC